MGDCERCPICHGSGWTLANPGETPSTSASRTGDICTTCNGRGIVWRPIVVGSSPTQPPQPSTNLAELLAEMWTDRDELRKENERLRERLRYDCTGCPGCSTGDCPDALDSAHVENERLRVLLREGLEGVAECDCGADDTLGRECWQCRVRAALGEGEQA